jgi:hypothetical protein
VVQFKGLKIMVLKIWKFDIWERANSALEEVINP